METRLGVRQRRRPPTVHRGSTHAPRLQRPVATEDEASACSELRLGCHPETPVIEPCPERTRNGEVDSDSLFRGFRWIPWLISDRLAEVIPGSLEESHVHRSANSWKTLSAGYALVWPASKAASRFSASLAQSSSIRASG